MLINHQRNQKVRYQHTKRSLKLGTTAKLALHIPDSQTTAVEQTYQAAANFFISGGLQLARQKQLHLSFGNQSESNTFYRLAPNALKCTWLLQMMHTP